LVGRCVVSHLGEVEAGVDVDPRTINRTFGRGQPPRHPDEENRTKKRNEDDLQRDKKTKSQQTSKLVLKFKIDGSFC
jgi:hypothetical protein